MGSALDDLRDLPAAAQDDLGYQLGRAQQGLDPDDWKPMKDVGPGCRETRVRTPDGAFRTFYVAQFGEAIYVLHCFHKKTQKTSNADITPLQGSPGIRTGDIMTDKDITETTSVWEAISDTPGEAYNRQLRADLMTAIRAQIDRFGWSQAVAADNLGVTQPRISDLHRGKLSKFSLDALVNLGSEVGVHLDVHIDTDRTLTGH